MRRRGRFVKFLEIFLLGTEPSPELLGAFALGLLVVGLVGDVTYGLLTEPVKSQSAIIRPLVAAACLTGLAYLLYWYDRRRGRAVRVMLDESRWPPPHEGLIWLFGPGNFEHLLFALNHHREGGGGNHCWLVMQDIPPVQEAFNKLSRHLLDQGVTTQLHRVYIQQLDVRASYRAVRTIFEREAGEAGLPLAQVIADMTGGTKPLTAGMVLAALTTGGALEYVESKRDAEGRYIPGTQQVVLMDTTFYVTREE